MTHASGFERPTRSVRALGAGLAGIALLLAACGGSHPAASTSASATSPAATSSGPVATTSGSTSSPSQSPVPHESAVPKESSPPGDIPDTTQFVPYRSSSGHFVVKVPEGWSRTTKGSTVSFTDKLNSVTVTWGSASSAPTVSTVKSNQVPQLQTTERAFTLGKVLDCSPSCNIPYSTAPIDVHLQVPSAIVLTYEVNSEPNSVTGKQYRLEVVRFDFYRNGVEADLILSGPVGSDNVDPWRTVAQSFQWS
jgi:hypothetical protein